MASHKRKVKVSRKEVPKTAADLKENIKACIRDKKIPVVQADDREDGWQEFQELLDFEVFLLDCKLLNDDMVGLPTVLLLTVALHALILFVFINW